MACSKIQAVEALVWLVGDISGDRSFGSKDGAPSKRWNHKGDVSARGPGWQYSSRNC